MATKNTKSTTASKGAAKKANPGPTRDPKPNGLFTARTTMGGPIDPSKSVAARPAARAVSTRTAATAPAGPTGPVAPGGGGSDAYGPGGGAGALDAFGLGGDTGGFGDEDWLAGDAQYQAQLAALLKAAADSTADFDAQQGKYDIDYNDAIKSLGWIQPVADDPNTVGVDESKAGAWNFNDANTAAGRSQQNLTNDFASRGLLQSSLFSTAQDDLLRSLSDQLTGINTGRQTFLDDLGRQRAAAASENSLSQQQARAEALARRAAGISLV